MKLTDHQQSLFDTFVPDILKGLDGDDDYSLLSLNGPAGSGKTVMLSEIIKLLNTKRCSMCITAPTHKAVSIIRETLKENDVPPIDCRTIHSFLKLKLIPNLNTGIEILTPDKFAYAKQGKIDILFCDESSMVSSELLDYCIEQLEKGLVKVVVMVGDLVQLPPVDTENGDGICDFVQTDDEYQLTEVVRQVEDNPIIKTSVKLRECITTKTYPPIHTLFDDLTVVDNKQEFISRYLADTSYKMVGTYTNTIVNEYNALLRKEIKNNPEDSIIVGDELMFYDTFMNGKSIVRLNADISTVVSCTKNYDPQYEIHYWSITDMDYCKYRVVASESRDKFDRTLATFADKASKESDAKTRQRLWGSYYAMKKKYANVRYNYASTLHRLQGSTVDNIYVDASDLHNEFYDRDIVFRLLYVAITRARHEAIILI